MISRTLVSGSSSAAAAHLFTTVTTSEIAPSSSSGIGFDAIEVVRTFPEGSPSLGRGRRRPGLGSRSGVSMFRSNRRPPTVLNEISLEAGLASRPKLPRREDGDGDGDTDGRREVD